MNNLTFFEEPLLKFNSMVKPVTSAITYVNIAEVLLSPADSRGRLLNRGYIYIDDYFSRDRVGSPLGSWASG